MKLQVQTCQRCERLEDVRIVFGQVDMGVRGHERLKSAEVRAASEPTGLQEDRDGASKIQAQRSKRWRCRQAKTLVAHRVLRIRI